MRQASQGNDKEAFALLKTAFRDTSDGEEGGDGNDTSEGEGDGIGKGGGDDRSSEGEGGGDDTSSDGEWSGDGDNDGIGSGSSDEDETSEKPKPKPKKKKKKVQPKIVRRSKFLYIVVWMFRGIRKCFVICSLISFHFFCVVQLSKSGSPQRARRLF